MTNERFEIILTTDRTMMSDHHGKEFIGFMTTGPPIGMPEFLWMWIAAPKMKTDELGRPWQAPYAMRKLEALLQDHGYNAAEELGYPLVVKPIYGSWGRMICRALDQESLEEILELRENMQSPHFKIHYLQEYIEKPGRDIRAYYVWGDVPVAIYMVSSRWKTNTALGGRAVKADLTPEQVELVKRAGEVMGGGILGVDLVEKGDQNLVLELNGIPQYKNVVRVTGYDLSRKMIESTIQYYKR